MKTTIRAALAALLILNTALAQQQKMFDDRPKISVTGEAVVSVVPDKIVVTLGIETSDLDISVARNKSVELIKTAKLVMKEIGIRDDAIQTDHLSIEPRYRNEYLLPELISYYVRTSMAVTLSDPGKIEELVTKVLESGVNYIHGVDFQTTELRKHRDKARELALRAAKEKAEMMAGVLGESIGDPIQINEHGSGSDWWYPSSWSGWGFGRGGGMSQNVMQNAPAASGEPMESIALGKISIRASVSVTFALKD